jgi:hypothetical protein
MRSYYLLLFVSFCLSLHTNAQKRKTFKIRPGEKLVEIIPQDEKYSYATFIDGYVYFRKNTYSAAKLNYNSLYGEMQFIDDKGDTLSLADESGIKLIVINSDTFYFDKGYLKQLENLGEIKLARKTFFTFTNRQKLGAFGETTSASVDTYNAISGSNYFKELVAKEILTIAKYSVFFIGDRFNNFKELNKKNLLEFYSKNGSELQAYLKDSNPDFANEEDIKKMLRHFNSAFQH